jgi:hypothetical protein
MKKKKLVVSLIILFFFLFGLFFYDFNNLRRYGKIDTITKDGNNYIELSQLNKFDIIVKDNEIDNLLSIYIPSLFFLIKEKGADYTVINGKAFYTKDDIIEKNNKVYFSENLLKNMQFKIIKNDNGKIDNVYLSDYLKKYKNDLENTTFEDETNKAIKLIEGDNKDNDSKKLDKSINFSDAITICDLIKINTNILRSKYGPDIGYGFDDKGFGTGCDVKLDFNYFDWYNQYEIYSKNSYGGTTNQISAWASGNHYNVINVIEKYISEHKKLSDIEKQQIICTYSIYKSFDLRVYDLIYEQFYDLSKEYVEKKKVDDLWGIDVYNRLYDSSVKYFEYKKTALEKEKAFPKWIVIDPEISYNTKRVVNEEKLKYYFSSIKDKIVYEALKQVSNNTHNGNYVNANQAIDNATIKVLKDMGLFQYDEGLFNDFKDTFVELGFPSIFEEAAKNYLEGKELEISEDILNTSLRTFGSKVQIPLCKIYDGYNVVKSIGTLYDVRDDYSIDATDKKLEAIGDITDVISPPAGMLVDLWTLLWEKGFKPVIKVLS